MWLIYVFGSIYISKLIYVVVSGIGWLISKISGIFKRGSNRGYKTGCIIAAIISVSLFAVLWTGVLYTRSHIETRKIEIESDRLPDGFDGFKIIQFSDLHVGTWGSDTTFVSKVVDEINSKDPDLIVFTGDIVNRKTDELRPFLNVLNKLKSRNSVISVLGNHDYGDYMDWKSEEEHKLNNSLLAEWESEMGWDLINNDHRYIKHNGDSIVIIGVENWGEPPFRQYGNLTQAYNPTCNSKEDLNDNKFKILLSHNPEHWNREVSKISNIDLTLSGHTHAMQAEIGVFGRRWSPAAWRYPQWGGLYKREKKDGNIVNLYVNIGSGEVGIPARFGVAYPELTEITLRKKK